MKLAGGSGSHQLQKPVHILDGHCGGRISKVSDWKSVLESEKYMVKPQKHSLVLTGSHTMHIINSDIKN
jgi:hypothetical protein